MQPMLSTPCPTRGKEQLDCPSECVVIYISLSLGLGLGLGQGLDGRGKFHILRISSRERLTAKVSTTARQQDEHPVTAGW